MELNTRSDIHLHNTVLN